MKLAVIAVGRLKNGPERDLVERYRERTRNLARSVGLAPLHVIEISESRGRREADRRAEEGGQILQQLGPGILTAFDERGRTLSSEAFAQQVARWRDEGTPALHCVIGGPDGLDASVRSRADLVLSFGALTLPHQLVRVLVIEQLYRSLTIMAGHPYHRAGQDEP